jgi:hypothetical protein
VCTCKPATLGKQLSSGVCLFSLLLKAQREKERKTTYQLTCVPMTMKTHLFRAEKKRKVSLEEPYNPGQLLKRPDLGRSVTAPLPTFLEESESASSEEDCPKVLRSVRKGGILLEGIQKLYP